MKEGLNWSGGSGVSIQSFPVAFDYLLFMMLKVTNMATQPASVLFQFNVWSFSPLL